MFEPDRLYVICPSQSNHVSHISFTSNYVVKRELQLLSINIRV